MQNQSEDTHPEVKRVWMEMLRQMPIEKKFASMWSWSQSILDAARQNIEKEHPEASERESGLTLP